MSGVIEPVRGMRDVLPNDFRAAARVRGVLERTLASYGYQSVDLPVVEQRELYLRKLGEELVGKVYEFNFGGRNLALRPEWTASVLRAYVTHMQDQPLPLRLAYSGPVFRYERPQRVTYRQFTQVGVELVGGTAPRADAEVLALACAGLDAVGVQGYRVILGHLGLARELLAGLDLTERTRALLVWSMEHLQNDGIEGVRSRIYEMLGVNAQLDLSLPAGLTDDEASRLLLRVFEATRVDLASGTRSPEDIVGRLLRKLKRGDRRPHIDRAIDLLARLATISGPVDEALPQLNALLHDAELSSTTLNEVQAILDLLKAHGIGAERIQLDFGLGRGLHYYTGMIFEIYSADAMQLCGGGRYDDLVTALGGRQSVPAAGFAYGLERVVAAAAASETPPRNTALVAPISAEDYSYALEVARHLRGRGFAAMVDVRERNVAANLRDAARRNIPFVAIVGAEEQAKQCFVWRNLATREEVRVALSAIDQLTP